MAGEQTLFAKLDTWLQAQTEPPNVFDVMATGDVELIGTFVLREFRAATREAVTRRLELEVSKLPVSDQDKAANPVMRVFDGLSEAWNLHQSEKLALLGMTEAEKLNALRVSTLDEITHETIGRVTVLLDIFRAILTLLPFPERAGAWVRKPNKASFFGGRSPLQRMMEEGRDGLGEVRAYLWAEVWSR